MSVEATATASSTACGPTSLPPWLININWISLVKQAALTCVSVRVCVSGVRVCAWQSRQLFLCLWIGFGISSGCQKQENKRKVHPLHANWWPTNALPLPLHPLPLSGSRSQWSVCPARNFQAIIVQLYWPTRRERYISRARNPTTLMEGTPNPWPLGTRLSGKQFNSWPRVRQLANRERAPTSVVSS